MALLRRHDNAGAAREVDAALRLRKNDAEAEQLKDTMARAEIVDGRNLLDGPQLRQKGFSYTGIGRS